MTEKNEIQVTILGKEVSMRYCNAAEDAFEDLSPETISIFIAEKVKGDDGKDIVIPPRAKNKDYKRLAIGCMVAYYAYHGGTMPVTTEDILYKATPEDTLNMINALSQIRSAWYTISEALAKKLEEEAKAKEAQQQEDGDKPKNS